MPAWPPGAVLTPSSTVPGTFSPASIVLSGSGPAVFTFTPGGAGTGSINSSAPGMANTTGALTYTAMTLPSVPGAGQPAIQKVVLPQPAVFVSPSGSDSNAGTQAAPLRTPAGAQSAMRAMGIKNAVFRDGVYPLGASLVISEADNGTRWMGYPGEKPIFDGGGSVVGAIVLQYLTTGVVVDHPTVRNCMTAGIWLHGGQGAGVAANAITNNEIYSIGMTGLANGCGNSAGILCTFNTQRNLIMHNYTHDMACVGIAMASGSSVESIAGNVVTFNHVARVNNTGQLDSGGIYALDRTGAQSGILFACNFVEDTSRNPSGGGPGSGCDNTKGIYLDDMTSGATVSGNIVCGNQAMAIQYHGGTNNAVTGNLLDLSQTTLGVIYQDDAQFGGTVMSGNSFTKNILWSNAVYNGNVGQANQPGIWTIGYIDGLTKPDSHDNLYWNTAAPFPTGGDVTDSSPHVLDPHLRNPAGRDYSFSDGGAAVRAAIGFQPFDLSLIGPNVQTL